MQSPYWRGFWLGTWVGALAATIGFGVFYTVIRWETSRELVSILLPPENVIVAAGIALPWLIAYPLAAWLSKRRTASRRPNG